jgi:membrane-bound metal-dependent hydrolase YbcI (DUF457 family)
MKFISHLLFGIIALVIFFFLINPDLSVLVLAGVAMLLGSVLPDIDHPFAYVRKAFRLILFVTISIFLFLFLSITAASQLIQQQCENYGCSNFVILVQLLISAIVGFILVMVIDFFIPFHRGPLHGLTAAVGYAIICGIISMTCTPSYFAIAAAGLIGYLSHIIPDALFKE